MLAKKSKIRQGWRVLCVSLVLSFFCWSPNLASAATPTEDFLGTGFGEITGYSEDLSNTSLESRPAEFQEGGVGILNKIFYNVKDFFKYMAGGVGILWLLIAAFQMIIASNDEMIQKGKKNFTWGLYALFFIFLIDIFVITGFEGGYYKDPDPQQDWYSLVSFDPETGERIENRPLMEGIAKYFDEEVRLIFAWLKRQIAVVAVLFTVIMGIKMVMARGDEEDIEKAKKYMIKMLGAFLTILMLDHFIFGVIYPVSTDTGLNAPECVEFLNSVEFSGKDKLTLADVAEAPPNCRTALELGQKGTGLILGIVRFLESLLGAVAVFVIIFSGLSLVTSFANEENATRHKKALMWAILGLVVVLISHNVIMQFFFVVDPQTGEAGVNPQQGLLDLAGIINFLLTFLSVFATIAIIVAGIMWVVNFGNTEVVDKAKKTILWAVAGVIIAISGYALTNTLITGNPQGMQGGDLKLEGEGYHLDLGSTWEGGGLERR